MAAEDVVWHIERLRRVHRRDAFDCGVHALNEFLQRYARQNDAKGLSRTYVAVRLGEKDVRGYYSLSSGSIFFRDLRPEQRKHLPRYPIPVAHLGRLAVDRSERHQGLGETLLMHAMSRTVEASEQVGIYAVEVVATSEQARAFYAKYGFSSLVDDELHMYISMKAVRKALGG